MNELYAIDPEAVKDVRDLRIILREFGLMEGRFIAELPRNWASVLKESLALRPLDERRMIELLARAKDSFEPTSFAFKPLRSWIDNIYEIQTTRNVFADVFSTTSGPFHRSIDTLIESDNYQLKVGRSGNLPATSIEYRKAAAPLIRRSEELVLLDSYFCLRHESKRYVQEGLDRRRIRVLEAIVDEMYQSVMSTQMNLNQKRRLLLVLNEAYYDSSSKEDTLQRDLEDILNRYDDPSKIEILYEITKIEEHPRFLFSIKGGLHFDNGFEELSKKGVPGTNLITWQPAATIRPFQEKYLRYFH